MAIGYFPIGYFPDGYFPDEYWPDEPSGSGVSASSAQTLPKLTQSASGTERFVGTCAQTLPKVAQSVVGTEVFTGTISETLPRVGQAASATETFQASAAQTLPHVGQAAAASESFVSTVAETLPKIAQAVAALESFQSAISQALPHVSQSAAGTSVNPNRIAQTLPKVSQDVTVTIVNPQTLEAEKALINILLADASVRDRFGNRIYFAQSPQTARPPYAVVSRKAASRTYSLNSVTGLARAEVTFCVFDRTSLGANNGADLIREALDGYRGTNSGVNLQAVILLAEMDGKDEETELMELTQDYGVWFQE